MRARRTVVVILSVVGLLFFGGITTITQDDYLQTTTTNAPGAPNAPKTFDYPWFGNFLMFLAMALVGVGWVVEACRARRKKTATTTGETQLETSTQLLDVSEEATDAPRNTNVLGNTNTNVSGNANVSGTASNRCWDRFMRSPWCVLIFTAVFDLIASGLGSIGLSPQCNVPPSVYQMLQVSVVVFTALLSFCFLKRRITRAQILGIGVCVLGLAIVALSTYLADRFYPDTEGKTTETTANSASKPGTGMLFVGIGLIILGQLIYAAQFTLEEYTLSRIDAFSTQVVCIEGIYGLLLTVCLTMPILWATGVEDDYEAFRFLGGCPKILLPIGVFFVCVAFYNGFGQTITKNISANHRTVIEGLRGLVVWVFALIERKIFGKPWGEAWRGWASVVQAVGFVVQLLGSLIFYGVIPVRCLEGGKEKGKGKGKKTEKESCCEQPSGP